MGREGKTLRRSSTFVVQVLDLGSGSGLLAMMAARLGAKEVVAVEAAAEMAEVAQQNVAKNGLKGKVKILRMLSTEMKTPKPELQVWGTAALHAPSTTRAPIGLLGC